MGQAVPYKHITHDPAVVTADISSMLSVEINGSRLANGTYRHVPFAVCATCFVIFGGQPRATLGKPSVETSQILFLRLFSFLDGIYRIPDLVMLRNDSCPAVSQISSLTWTVEESKQKERGRYVLAVTPSLAVLYCNTPGYIMLHNTPGEDLFKLNFSPRGSKSLCSRNSRLSNDR